MTQNHEAREQPARLFRAAILAMALSLAVAGTTFAEGESGNSGMPNEVANSAAVSNTKSKCEAPSFGIAATGYDDFALIATADPPQRFIVELNYMNKEGELRELPEENRLRSVVPGFACAAELHTSCVNRDQQCFKNPDCVDSVCEKGCECSQDLPEGSSVRLCVHATPAGASVPFRADRGLMLKTSGQLGFRWQAHPGDVKPELCPNRFQGPEQPTIKVIPKHSLGFDVGFVYNLEPDGKFKSNLEAAFFARSQWSESFLAGFEARYSAIEPSDEAAMMDAEPQEGDPPTDAEEMQEPPSFNPFDEGGGGGVAELDGYLAWAPWKRAARFYLLAGAGLSTVPGDGSFTEVKTRTYFGLRLAVEGFNAGERDRGDFLQNARGNVQVALAEDKLYENVVLVAAVEDSEGNLLTPAVTSDESERFRLTGEIELPRVGTDWLRIVLRGHASIPRSGDGPSDLRISALASIDPREWFGGVGRPRN